MTKEAVTITDHRTGESYDIDLVDGALPAIALRQIKTPDDDFGLMTYDPAFTNTASCRSTITYIDGDKGILEYRGYPIEELAEKSSFLEVAHLLLHGELPSGDELNQLAGIVGENMAVDESMKKFIDGFLPEAHPMGMLISSVACLSTYYPDAKNVSDPENRLQQIHRLLSKVPTLSAYAFRRNAGLSYLDPDPSQSFAANFLRLVFADEDGSYTPSPILERAMDVLFTLHADHEQNCSTSAMRGVGSSYTDPYSSLAAAAAALYGPLHGGANEAVLRMLNEIGDKEKIPAFIEQVKNGDMRLMGFGHRVYKNYDPRAKIIKKLAYEVFEVQGMNPLLDIALELEKIALEDEYFVGRKLYPNVDFYSGLIYQSMGFPTPMFPVLFAIGRTSGWLSQWNEFFGDKDQRIARPRQLYQGSPTRPYEK
ncbi:MAG: citrate synthase [Planctomycetota bacterium]|nr:citrate synthase [Planctomycetota bacterium]